MGSLTRVTFLRDYQGRATLERFFTTGQTVYLPSWAVGLLRAEGVVAVPVEAGAADPSPAAPVVKRAATKRASKKAVKRDE